MIDPSISKCLIGLYLRNQIKAEWSGTVVIIALWLNTV